MNDLPDNRDNQLAADATTEAALRRHFAAPTENAPFLTFDAIARRVSAAPVADESAQLSALAADELGVADVWTPPWTGDAAHSREKEMPMIPYDTGQTHDATVPTNTFGDGYPPHVALADSAAPGDPHAAPHRPTGRGADASANRPAARTRHVAQSVFAVAAAIMIVGLLGAVLYNFGVSHRSKGPVVHHTPPQVQYLGAKAQWQVVGQFPVDPYLKDQPEYFVAQSDPMIVYKTSAGRFVMQRSTDGGQTWQNITLPQQDFPGISNDGVSLIVSPVNTQVLILTLRSGAENPNCPSNADSASRSDTSVRHSMGRGAATQSSGDTTAAQFAPKVPASGGYSCSFQYISSDGGASWSAAHLPGGAQILNVTPQHVVDAHGKLIGSRLYALASPNVTRSTPTVYRLLLSLNGGLTWAFADQSLYAQGWEAYTFTATPTGSIVFAETTTTVGGAHTGTDLWRTGDAGAHWTDLGPTALFTTFGALEGYTATAVGDKTLLYADANNAALIANDGTPYNGLASAPDQVYVSPNNGHTWQRSPIVGVPAGMDSPDSALGTLSDGAAVFQFNKIRVTESGAYFTITYSDTAYYAWSPGANAWVQLTPSLDGEPSAQAGVQWLVPAHDGQPETIWVFITRGNTQYLEKCALS